MSEASWEVSHWMSKKVFTVPASGTIADAFELMREHRIRHIPVIEKGQLAGIVSDRDIRPHLPTRKKLAEGDEAYGKTLRKTAISDVMSRHPITITPEWTIQEAAKRMCREKVSCLPVMDKSGLIGIISAEDLLWAFVENTQDLND